ncbi:SRPBCC family protein [Streptomyces sp. NPDC020681]|uniref:SRPBCC family protein n=1 Tax=Streptomyces sp. NPDC020681 TaxID=3365083 RepID=UPI0037A63D1C
MTSPEPTGRLLRTEHGRDLVLTRTLGSPLPEVWASLTESERTARWIGPWKGEAGPGKTVEMQLVFEEGAPWSPFLIEACEPPHLLTVSIPSEGGSWPMEVRLSEADGGTAVELVHRLSADGQASGEAGLGAIGPGWEYYLDMFLAAHEGRPLPSFDDYYPAQQEYFEQLEPEPRATDS